MIAIMSDSINAVMDRLKPALVELAAGEMPFRRGDAVRRFFQVVSGEIHVLRHLENGSVLVQQRARAGDFVSEPSLHSTSYHCDAVAFLPSRLRSVARDSMLAALRADPSAQEAWTLHLARQMQRARHRAEILSFRHLAERLDAWLDLNGGQLPPKGDWKTLAGEIAASPEALYRELARRRKAGGP